MTGPAEFATLSVEHYVPGPIADFNLFPLIGPGAVGPLQYHPAEASQTPEIMRMGVGRLVTFRQWGLPTGYIPTELATQAIWKWARGPDQEWGVGQETAQLDAPEQFDSPASAAEVLHEYDVQRCIDINPGAIVATGVAFELLRETVPNGSVSVLQYYPTTLEVDALDENGDAIFTYSQLNGEEPCRSRVVHPDPLVGLLTWQWRITTTHNAAQGTSPALVVGAAPGAVPGDDIVQPWTDLRNGNQQWWPDRRQHPVMSRTIIRYFVALFGPPDRYRVRVGGRLGGYWQIAGRRGAAVRSATERFV